MFDYSKIHIFDKKGVELPLNYDSNIKIVISNTYSDNAVFFGTTDASSNLTDFYKVTSGGRFVESDFSTVTGVDSSVIAATIYTSTGQYNGLVPVEKYRYYTSNLNDFYINRIAWDAVHWDDPSLDPRVWCPDVNDLSFPSITFSSKLDFDKVSTELVETQSLYFLLEYTDPDGNTNYMKPVDYLDILEYDGTGSYVRPQFVQDFADWCERYELIGFIDCRQQEDFRIFTVDLHKDEEVVWSDRNFIKLNSDNENGYRLNIGFSGSNEGVYEQSLYICVIDKFHKKYDEDPGDVYPIGEIIMSAETEGEDERYRTLFTNFGIPDPKTYNDIFRDSDTTDEKDDYISINKHSKKIFLTYSEIFPYAGSYKALMNAVETLGYDDIFFKEWYKYVGTSFSDKNKYIAYDMSYDYDISKRIINTVPLEERLKLKKLNWISMMYNLNKELYDVPEDKYGFPSVEITYNYYNTDNIIKLLSLRRWLEKYITGLNCRIIDVGGEGIYFERYSHDAYGTYQRLIEYNSEVNLTPVVINEDNVLKDSSSNIIVQVDKMNNNKTFDDYLNIKFEDLCDGFLDSSDNYNVKTDEIFDASIIVDNEGKYSADRLFIGKTFDDSHSEEPFILRASSATDNFIFGNEYVDINSPRVLIRDNVVGFDAQDLIDKSRNSAFTKLPVIQFERATLRNGNGIWDKTVSHKIYPIYEKDTITSYVIQNVATGEKFEFQDYPTFIPPTYVDSSQNVTISPVGKNSFTINKWRELEAILDFSDTDNEYQRKVYENNTTYGLRFSKINSYNIPVFSIIGYTVDNYPTDIINPQTEYYLDILDGKMMFEDPENKRRIYINFTYHPDTNTKTIGVNIIYQSEEFNDCVYMSGTSYSFSKFFKGKQYTQFKETYRTDINKAIQNNVDSHGRYVKKLKVNNCGEFNVDLITYKDNIAMGARANKTANVRTPDPCLTVYTNEPNSNNEYNLDGEYVSIIKKNQLTYEFNEGCVYDFREPVRNISMDSSTMELTYPSYPYNTYIPKVGERAHFINNMDKFKLAAVDNVIIKSNMVDFYLVLNRWDNKEYSHVHGPHDTNALLDACNQRIDNNVAKDLLNKAAGNTNSEALDVNVVLYDELNNSIVVQMPGKMLNAGCISNFIDSSYSSNEYHLYIQDDLTTGSYERYRYIYHNPETDEKKFKVQGGYLYQKITDSSWSGVFTYIEDPTDPEHTTKEYMIDAENYIDEEGKVCIKYRLPFFNDMELNPLTGYYEIVNRVVTRVDDSYIMKYIKDTNIGIYVEPTWKEYVNVVGVIADENLIMLEFPYELYKGVFKKGDMVKIVYESEDNSEYIGQAAYEVYGYNEANTCLLVKGRINEAYVAREYVSIVYAVLNAKLVNTGGYDEIYEYAVTENGNLAWWDSEANVYKTTFTYTDPSTPTQEHTYTLKAIDYQYTEIEGEKIHQIFYQVVRWNSEEHEMDLAVHTNTVKSSATKTYISYAHNACVDYNMEIENLKDFNADYATIKLETNSKNRLISNYVDTTFGMIYRDFDINEGSKGWMGSKLSVDLDVYPNITLQTMYKYNRPVTLPSENPCIVFEVDFEKLSMDVDDTTVCWKIYRRKDEYGNQDYLFESFTKRLYLDYDEPGIYDLELYLYDKFGNLHYRDFKGAYTIE